MHEAELPGVGKKCWITTSAGEKVTIIRHNIGKIEVYHFMKGEESPSRVFELTEEEARQIGAILTGRCETRIVETMDVVMKDLVIEWVKIEPSSSMVGKSIKEMEIRKKTGVSIVAIIREEAGIPSPAPDEIIHSGDLLLIIGRADQIDKFKNLNSTG
ncbi:MAG: cation:proton antiporter regulatory subunit [Nitrospirota bacterium]